MGNPAADWLYNQVALYGPGVALVAAFILLGSILRGLARLAQWVRIRAGRRIPAAPDNQPGTNTDDLWTCRRILTATNTRKETKP